MVFYAQHNSHSTACSTLKGFWWTWQPLLSFFNVVLGFRQTSQPLLSFSDVVLNFRLWHRVDVELGVSRENVTHEGRVES